MSKMRKRFEHNHLLLTGFMSSIVTLGAIIALNTAITTSVALGQGGLFNSPNSGGNQLLGDQKAEPEAKIPDHNPANEVDLGDGLIIVDLVTGDGDAVTDGSLAITNFTGWTANTGRVFNTTIGNDNGPYARLIPSPDQVIEGWNRGLMGMKVGGKRKIMVPAALGYREYGYRQLKVPPNTDLVFEVDLLDVVTNVDFSKLTNVKTTPDKMKWADLRPGKGDSFVEGGYASCFITVWDNNNVFKGTTYSKPTPMTVKSDSPSHWVKYALGMKSGGRRVAQFSQPRPIPSDKYKEAMDNNEKPEPEYDTWLVVIDAVEVQEPLKIIPHDPTKEYDIGKGLIVVDRVIGEGKVLDKNGMALINYTGWLEDGTVFDSTQVPGKEPRYVAKGLDVEALDLGVQGMRIGGKRKLIVPPSLGFGANGSIQLRVPPNATLIYEIELVDWEMPLFMPVDENGNSGSGLNILGDG